VFTLKIAVVSYSLTGNNEALARSVAGVLAAEHIKIQEPKQRTTGTIILDVLFNRTPKTEPKPARLENYDLVLFFGPVWMGQAAFPLRPYLKHPKLGRYAFVSLSGGAMNDNPKLANDLKKRSGKDPAALIDLHVTDLLPAEPKPGTKETSAYRINEADRKKLTNTIVDRLNAAVGTGGGQIEK
jgi:hypothetical protein